MNEKEIMHSMISNTNYIEWLVNFMQNKDSFTEEWLFIANRTDPNRTNVKYLSLLYEVIDNYAKNNHIYPTRIENDHFYNIRYHGISLQIGYNLEQGTTYFCKKVPLENEKSFIDFNDIMTGRRQYNVDEINETLNELSNYITSIYEEGVPLPSIINTLDDVVKRLNNKEDEKVKKYTKERND